MSGKLTKREYDLLALISRHQEPRITETARAALARIEGK